ncbi:hypothetical protein J2S20_000718 [Moryella indoligenes]|uniref:Zinc-ribbon domain-containing protein n=1 Tax=Moryella indoligenes TaxID=371674 RepID=A0AAE4ALC2_9FIRM|nr:DUF898 family protein [Moryella indoligenes]MDQ0152036.1 hypothetical protein [Moryella indoligenes]
MKFCSNCGKPVDATAKFCMNCGAPLHHETAGGAAPQERAPQENQMDQSVQEARQQVQNTQQQAAQGDAAGWSQQSQSASTQQTQNTQQAQNTQQDQYTQTKEGAAAEQSSQQNQYTQVNQEAAARQSSQQNQYTQVSQGAAAGQSAQQDQYTQTNEGAAAGQSSQQNQYTQASQGAAAGQSSQQNQYTQASQGAAAGQSSQQNQYTQASQGAAAGQSSQQNQNSWQKQGQEAFNDFSKAAGDRAMEWTDKAMKGLDGLPPTAVRFFCLAVLFVPLALGIILFPLEQLQEQMYWYDGPYMLVGFLMGLLRAAAIIITLIGVGLAAREFLKGQSAGGPGETGRSVDRMLPLIGAVFALLACGSLLGIRPLCLFLVLAAIIGVYLLITQQDSLSRAAGAGAGMAASGGQPVPGSEFDGKGLEYLGYSLLAAVVNAVTCGIAWPWMQCRIVKWRKNHTLIEGRRLDFNGTGGQMFGLYIKWVLLSLVTCGIYTLFVPVDYLKWEMKHTFYYGDQVMLDHAVPGSEFDGNTFECAGYMLLCFIITVCTCGLALPWAIAFMKRWEMRHKLIGGRRLSFGGTGLQFFGHYLLIALFSVLSCGIYASWGQVRIWRWIYRHCSYENG